MCSKDKNSSEDQVINEASQQDEHNTTQSAEVEIEQVDCIENEKDLRIATLETQLAEAVSRERDALLRSHAEVDNIRRRAEQDVEKAHRFALEKFSSELLPVIDNLERALALSNKDEPTMVPMIEGLELTLKSFLDTVRKFGIEVVDAKDVPFNPDLHQAMTIIESPAHAPNHVVDMMQKGYTLNGRLLRPAMVVVSK